MQVRYFGSSERALLGVYSPPEAALEREAVVLLCHPAPQEYMRSHWALRQLAARLAAAGLHVLRFDYSGTGDSAGDSSAGASLEAWRADVLTATRGAQRHLGRQAPIARRAPARGDAGGPGRSTRAGTSCCGSPS